MNIPNKFDLYLENKLSKSEKNKFERELSEHPELAESYKVYSQINRTLEKELISPLLNDDEDPLLKELSISQRLAIEEDFIRFYSKKNEDPDNDSKGYEDANSADSVYSNQFQVHKIIEDEENDEQRFLKVLNNVSQNKSPGKLKINRLYLGIAATVVLSFFAGKIIFGLIFPDNKKLSPQQAYAYYYNPETDNEIKSLIFNDSRLETIFLDFKRSSINSSEIFSNKMEVSDEDYELSLLYLGLIYIERNDFTEARKCFTQMLSIKNSKKNNTARFYMSLSYLSEGNFAEAEPFLNKLTETSNPYRKKAKAILQSVNH